MNIPTRYRSALSIIPIVCFCYLSYCSLLADKVDWWHVVFYSIIAASIICLLFAALIEAYRLGVKVTATTGISCRMRHLMIATLLAIVLFFLQGALSSLLWKFWISFSGDTGY